MEVEVVELFDRCFTEEFQKDLVRVIYAGHAAAEDEAAAYPMAEGRDLIGHLRRARIEAGLRSLARHAGVTVEAMKNSRGTSSHRIVESNEMRLTTSAVDDRYKRPREADFRMNLSLVNQMSLFEPVKRKPKKKPIYGIVLYCASDSARFPCFIDVAFPRPGIKGYGARVRLMERFPDLINELTNPQRVQEEIVADEALPKFKDAETREGNA